MHPFGPVHPSNSGAGAAEGRWPGRARARGAGKSPSLAPIFTSLSRRVVSDHRSSPSGSVSVRRRMPRLQAIVCSWSRAALAGKPRYDSRVHRTAGMNAAVINLRPAAAGHRRSLLPFCPAAPVHTPSHPAAGTLWLVWYREANWRPNRRCQRHRAGRRDAQNFTLSGINLRMSSLSSGRHWWCVPGATPTLCAPSWTLGREPVGASGLHLLCDAAYRLRLGVADTVSASSSNPALPGCCLTWTFPP